MSELDGPRFGPAAGGAPDSLVVLLHGVGADGHDLIDLAPHLGTVLPHALFIAPHAPEPYQGAPYGRQWFPLWDRSPPQLEAGVQQAAAVLGAWLTAETARLGLGPGRLALAGFSQGAMTALYTGLRGYSPAPACILAYSGALLGAATLAAAIKAKPPVLLVHGEADEVVPAAASRAAEAALHAAGVPAKALYRAGLGHGIDEAGIVAGAEMLRSALSSP